jgi:hypothetical protein
MLPSKMIPDIKNRKRHPLKRKAMKTTTTATAPPRKKARISSGTEVEVIEGENGPCAGTTICPVSSFQMSYPVPVKVCDVS